MWFPIRRTWLLPHQHPRTDRNEHPFLIRVREIPQAEKLQERGISTHFILLPRPDWLAVFLVALERAEIVHLDDNRLCTRKGLPVHVMGRRQTPARSTCSGALPIVLTVKIF